MKGNAKGFTLIELVIVIVILGILAAVAIPKFANLQEDAKKASIEGLRGAVNSAAKIVHAKWLVAGQPTGNIDLDNDSGTPNDNVSITNDHGYPTADATGILRAIDFDDEKFNFNSGSFELANDSDCSFDYYPDNGSAGPIDTNCGP